MKPPSIIEFLISLGGVRDDMGDLRAMDLHRVNKGVFGRLAHKKGMSLDRAREVCEEARYIRPDSTISDLLEAIRDQASGLSRLTPEDRGDSYQMRSADPYDDLVARDCELVEWRKRMGWTQARAAVELGVTRRTMIDYENGRHQITRQLGLACLALTMGYER